MNLLSLIALSSLFALAEPLETTDYKLQISSISYPLSALVTGSLGYARKIRDNTDKDRPWNYGYYRISANVYTNSFTNRIGPELAFYPVSILGISTGYEWGYKPFKPRNVDATKYNAQGALHRHHIRITGILGFKDFFSVTELRVDRLFPDRSSDPFFDEFSLSSGRSGGDTLFSLAETLGYKFDSKSQAGVTLFTSQMKHSQGNAFILIGFVNRPVARQWDVSLGAGAIRTDLFEKGALGYLGLTYKSPVSLQLQ